MLIYKYILNSLLRLGQAQTVTNSRRKIDTRQNKHFKCFNESYITNRFKFSNLHHASRHEAGSTMNLALPGSYLLLKTSLTPMQGCFSYLSEVGSHGPGSEIHLPKSL